MLLHCAKKLHGALLVNVHACVTPRLYSSCLGREAGLTCHQQEVSVTVSWLHAHMQAKGCCKSIHYISDSSSAEVWWVFTRPTIRVFFLLPSLCVPSDFSHSASSPCLHPGSWHLCHPPLMMAICDLELADFFKEDCLKIKHTLSYK